MYNNSTYKPSREDNYYYKPRKPHRNTPSFSSTLLDEIDNSIDGNEQKKSNGLKVFDEMPLRKQTNFSSVRGEESTAKVKIGVSRRISLMSELEKSALQERDLLFFSSTNYPEKIKPNVILDTWKMETGNDLTMKTKSTVYNKVYANLKKVKQPISPGGKLTSFINSLFANSLDKKSKKLGKDKVVQSPSSASSRSRVEMRDGIPFRFHLNVKAPLPLSNFSEDGEAVKHVFKSHKNDLSMFKGARDDGVDDDDDDFSDVSSDLFELDDHKAMFGKSRFCEELPVYETAYFVKNRVI
ncbi:hypothetical protein CASFOL_011190 [Castilleja foliolosa]|uniref:Protein BIG GRAIN 1-like E n=1 Tax=Castilleja foliolosa TaxID=1961234 RepID=A0ABD3DUT6_9LAMI